MKLLLIKDGLPEEGELVICHVTKIHFHSIFVNIIEYNHLQGMIHISEVSPGRIRNIRDFVKEGKTVVCRVLRTNHERRQVDLSLRRVNDGQKRQKINEIKQEQVAEKIIEHVATEFKHDLKKFFNDCYDKMIEEYDSIFAGFYDVVESNIKLENLGIGKKESEALEKIIRQRIKPIFVEIKGNFNVQSYEPDGVGVIKDTFEKTFKKVKGEYKITYKGAGKYDFYIKDKDYKKAEKVLKDLNDNIAKGFKKTDTTFECVRA